MRRAEPDGEDHPPMWSGPFHAPPRFAIVTLMRWVDDLLRIVRRPLDPAEAHAALVRAWRRSMPSPLWDELPAVDPAHDAYLAAQWLDRQLPRRRPAGVALLLDTLNMAGPRGFNVTAVSAARCDPASSALGWVFGPVQHGREPHLLSGLRAMRRVYAAARNRSILSRVDYAVPLGYSGVVLATAAALLGSRCPTVVAWGFHDGDLFVLGRRAGLRFERACVVESEA